MGVPAVVFIVFAVGYGIALIWTECVNESRDKELEKKLDLNAEALFKAREQVERLAAIQPEKCAICGQLDFPSNLSKTHEQGCAMWELVTTVWIHPKCRIGTKYDRRQSERKSNGKSK